MNARSLGNLIVWNRTAEGEPTRENPLWTLLVPREARTPFSMLRVGLGALAAGVVLRLLIQPWLHTVSPFTTFIPCVVFATLAGGAEEDAAVVVPGVPDVHLQLEVAELLEGGEVAHSVRMEHGT